MEKEKVKRDRMYRKTKIVSVRGSESREQRVQRGKVQASVKTRLKGNRRLSAGRSWRQKPRRESSGGGGTSQGCGPM